MSKYVSLSGQAVKVERFVQVVVGGKLVPCVVNKVRSNDFVVSSAAGERIVLDEFVRILQ
jgi:hypothetical protein